MSTRLAVEPGGAVRDHPHVVEREVGRDRMRKLARKIAVLRVGRVVERERQHDRARQRRPHHLGLARRARGGLESMTTAVPAASKQTAARDAAIAMRRQRAKPTAPAPPLPEGERAGVRGSLGASASFRAFFLPVASRATLSPSGRGKKRHLLRRNHLHRRRYGERDRPALDLSTSARVAASGATSSSLRSRWVSNRARSRAASRPRWRATILSAIRWRSSWSDRGHQPLRRRDRARAVVRRRYRRLRRAARTACAATWPGDPARGSARHRTPRRARDRRGTRRAKAFAPCQRGRSGCRRAGREPARIDREHIGAKLDRLAPDVEHVGRQQMQVLAQRDEALAQAMARLRIRIVALTTASPPPRGSPASPASSPGRRAAPAPCANALQ